MLKPAIKLHGRAKVVGTGGPTVLRVWGPGLSRAAPSLQVAWDRDARREPGIASSVMDVEVPPANGLAVGLRIGLPEDLSYLGAGDVIRVLPASGAVNVLYRRGSRFNSLLVTERCNSSCLMCSQPPKDVDDAFLVDELMQAVPLMAPDTAELGITGGEPTLCGERLFDLLRCIGTRLPNTKVHMLTNGRVFQYLGLAQRLADLGLKDLALGIPLYSDVPWEHDFVVQARGAFDETARGLLNLARVGVHIELRIVIHAQTYRRLPRLCEFVAKHFPFVDQVSLMGLELIGHVPMNLEALWIDPLDYQAELLAGVGVLQRRRVPVAIFNHQLCVLDRTLRPLAVQSISDWKNIYVETCEGCALRGQCGGFFHSSSLRRSRGIAAVVAPAV